MSQTFKQRSLLLAKPLLKGRDLSKDEEAHAVKHVDGLLKGLVFGHLGDPFQYMFVELKLIKEVDVEVLVYDRLDGARSLNFL